MSMQNLFKGGKATITKNYVNVDYYQREKAKECGAKWDSNKQKWYVDFDVELFLDNLTGLNKQQRYIKDIQRRIEGCLQSIRHNDNADITIFSQEYEDQKKKEIKKLQKQLDKELKLLKDNSL